MKKLLFPPFVIFAIIFFFFSESIGKEDVLFYFALPYGYPFEESSFRSELKGELRLAFGDRVDVIGRYRGKELFWYRAKKGGREFYLPEAFLVRNSASWQFDEDGNLVIGYERIDKNNALPLSYGPKDLISLPKRYRAEGYKERNLMLRQEAAWAFITMIDDAERDGVNIRVLSAFRDSCYQSSLYKRAIERHGLLQSAVAKPGHSEHQLGTTCDLTTDEISSALSRRFDETAAFRWLKANAYRYGISYSYPKYKERVTGYGYEPWHFRYWGENRWNNHIDRMGLFFCR